MNETRRIRIEMLACPSSASHASAVIDVAGTSTLVNKLPIGGLSPCQQVCALVEVALTQQGGPALSEAERANLSGKNHQEVLSA